MGKICPQCWHAPSNLQEAQREHIQKVNWILWELGQAFLLLPWMLELQAHQSLDSSTYLHQQPPRSWGFQPWTGSYTISFPGSQAFGLVLSHDAGSPGSPDYRCLWQDLSTSIIRWTSSRSKSPLSLSLSLDRQIHPSIYLSLSYLFHFSEESWLTQGSRGRGGIHTQKWSLIHLEISLAWSLAEKDWEIIRTWDHQRSKPMVRPFCCIRFLREIFAEGVRQRK